MFPLIIYHSSEINLWEYMVDYNIEKPNFLFLNLRVLTFGDCLLIIEHKPLCSFFFFFFGEAT